MKYRRDLLPLYPVFKQTLMKYGFDNAKYLKIQSEHIKDRIATFGDKLYMEFGGKLSTITTRAACFRASSRTASSRCSCR